MIRLAKKFAHTFGALALAGSISGIVAVSPAYADGPTVSGAGSTWSQVAVDQWRADVRTKLGLNINYQGNGSSSGRQFYVLNQVDFAVSEIPFASNEISQLKAAGKSYQYLPIVAGGTSVMYNLKDASGRQVTSLRLSPETLGKIFTGVISDWADPAITADQGGAALPARRIVPVVRSDGSGTSAQFTAFLAKATTTWSSFAGQQGVSKTQGTSNYPQGWGNSVAQKGSDGVANFVANPSTGVGSITYVETAYALQRRFPVAALKNKSGNFTLPTPANVATALKHATLNKDRTQNLKGVYNAGDATAYPMSSYSYMITPTSGLNPEKGKVLGAFMVYFACEGQQRASVLGYSPLPKNLIKAVFDAVKAIPGADAPPAIDAKHCANPTLSGSLGSGANNAGTSSGATVGGGKGTTTDTTTTGAGPSASPGATDTTGTTTTDGNTSGGTTIDASGYAPMQPVKLNVVKTGISPQGVAAWILGLLVILPVVLVLLRSGFARLAPFAKRFVAKLPPLWVRGDGTTGRRSRKS